MPGDVAPIPEVEVTAGQAIYTPRMLALYDLLVLRLSASLVWRCPSDHIDGHYAKYVTDNHLDVGVGTGYFLDRCAFRSPSPRIVLMDLNPHALAHTARRLRRYAPVAVRHNALDPVPAMPSFNSIALTYLLHCLPGSMTTKAVVLDHLRPLLAPGGVLFGATAVSQGVAHGLLARILMPLYNRKGIFCNRNDSLASLEAALRARFDNVTVETIGSIALFAARA